MFQGYVRVFLDFCSDIVIPFPFQPLTLVGRGDNRDNPSTYLSSPLGYLVDALSLVFDHGVWVYGAQTSPWKTYITTGAHTIP